MRYLSIITLCSISLVSFAQEKVTLKPNRTLSYNITPSEVDSFTKMFKEGIFYGRIRSNNFYFDWKDELENKRKDNYATGLGGSVAYKSAIYKGFSVNATLYGSESPLHMDKEDIPYVKAGKDSYSRYEAYTADNWLLYSLAVANIVYTYHKTQFVFGRQIFESLLTRSNDTKMIPNTFEGVSLFSKDIPNTTIKLGYFTRQKLRDHATFHDVITYAKDLDGSGDLNLKEEAWANNDDSVAHRGLNYFALKAHGKDTNNALVVAQMTNRSINNLQLMFNYTAILDLFYLATIEGKYDLTYNFIKITPSIRYMQQFDNGAGSVGGASLSTDTTGYSDPNSVDSYLVAAKIDAKIKRLKLRFGYSYVADKADIIAPWRGFPTGGYTRAMGQYNWLANTKTFLTRVDYKFENGINLMLRYAYQNFDEKKKIVMTDSNVYNIDVVYQPKSLAGFDTKLRIGYVDAKNYVGENYSPSYTDYRLEFNYLF